MRTVLCYGDSNTWGCVPVAGDSPPARFPPDERWPGVLRRELGAEYSIVEAGLNGRTTVWEDGLAPYRNGRDLLLPTLYTAFPVDVVVVMLGTNDLKRRFGVSAARDRRRSGRPRGSDSREWMRAEAGAAGCASRLSAARGASRSWRGGVCWSRRRSPASWRATSRPWPRRESCAFLDAGLHVASSETDGIHLDRGAHEALGKAIADAVRA